MYAAVQTLHREVPDRFGEHRERRWAFRLQGARDISAGL